MSYELSKIEKKVGTPEKPLSDLGKQTYLSFWTEKIVEYIKLVIAKGESFTLQDIIDNTAIKYEDMIDALEKVNLIKKVKNEIHICTNKALLDEIQKKLGQPTIPVLTENLRWYPFDFKYLNQENKDSSRTPV